MGILGRLFDYGVVKIGDILIMEIVIIILRSVKKLNRNMVLIHL